MEAPSVDDLLDVVVAPLFLRTVFGPSPDRAQTDALVDRLLAGRPGQTGTTLRRA